MNPEKYEAHDSLSSGGIEADDKKSSFHCSSHCYTNFLSESDSKAFI
jgi:hypothetical protein